MSGNREKYNHRREGGGHSDFNEDKPENHYEGERERKSENHKAMKETPEKRNRKQKTVRNSRKNHSFLPMVIGLVAFLFIVTGVVMAINPFGGSEANAKELPPQVILPTVTDVYDEGLVAMGKVTQDELEQGDLAMASAPMIPPKAKEYDPIVFSYPPAGKRASLTFDDGPSPKMVDDYLKVLSDNNVKASFFMLANSVKAYPDLAKKVDDAGHDVVSHSLRHDILPKLSPEELQNDFAQTNAIFKEVLGHQPKLMRPPYGSKDDAVLAAARDNGQLPVYWSIDTNDWRGNSTETMVNTIQSNLSDGAIILMHEGKTNTLAALPAIIKAVKDAGYEIVSLSELLKY